MRLKSLLMPLVGAVLALGTAQASATTIDDLLQRGSVRIGVDLSVPPFGITNASMEPDGLDVDIAKLLASDLGVELDLVPVTGQSRIPSLQTGKVDFVVASFGIYPERALSVAFSNPYGGHKSIIIAPQDVQIESLEDLSGLTVGVPRGTAHERILSEAGIEGMELVRFEDDSTTLNALVAGQVDAIGTVNFIAAELQERYPDRNFSEKVTYLESFYGVGVRQGEMELVHWLNTVLFVHNQSGELGEIYRKWMKTDLPQLPSF
ncbi:transporter substrate-binding domain-containing protein [Cucumibacter marinus]|uniref:transporter substrate-binding domain-containing protein n=1 Tax=Cucumibacter marinus TaxID=1121252 RepID=UPI00055C35CD|nr:transporter substrate-binding domain-containing protein [Cucumibacter marinus]